MEADSGDEEPPVDEKVQQNVEEKTDEDETGGDDEEDSRGAWGLVKSKWDKEEAFQRLGKLYNLSRGHSKYV